MRRLALIVALLALPTAAKAEAFLSERLASLPAGSFLVTVGAGDVFKLGEALLDG